MLTARTVIKDNESAENKILADISVNINHLDYERILKRAYPIILDKLANSPAAEKFPHIFSALQSLKEMTSDAAVKFLSSFPEEVKESLIKAAFDDIVNDDFLKNVNEKISEINLGAEISKVTLTAGEV